MVTAAGSWISPVAGDSISNPRICGHCDGRRGSDVALETADVALMADDLSTLPFAVGLSRASRRIIRQNLYVSLGVVALLIPATLFGWAGIGWAVVIHEGSTLVVVINALRLLANKEYVSLKLRAR